MERNVWKQGFAPAAGALDATAFSGMTYRERVQRQFKRINPRFKIPQKPYLDRHVLSNINNVELELGALYEINHKLVSSKSPNRLKFTRVAMVTEKNELNTEVKFPSMLALREYLSGGNTSVAFPDLDEQFVMDAKLAKEILYRKIPNDEFQQQKRLPCFWVVSSKIKELSGFNKVLNHDDGLLNYKVHKRIKFIMARHGSKSPRVSSSSSSDRTQNSADKASKRKKRKRKFVKQSNLSKGETKKPSSKTNGQNVNKLSDDRLSRSERNVQEMIQLVKTDDEAGDKATLPFTRSCSESDNKLNSSQQEKEDYERLMKRKAELEQELLQISQSLKGLQLKIGTDKGAELEEKANNSGSNSTQSSCDQGDKVAHSFQLDVDKMGFSVERINEIQRLQQQQRMYFGRAWLDRLKEQVRK